MTQWGKQSDEDRAAQALALRPGRITIYRELLAKQRQRALSPRDTVALEGVREFLHISGGIPTDEELSATPSIKEIEERG